MPFADANSIKPTSLGVIDAETIAKVAKVATEEEKRRQALMAARPSLKEILNLHDFEVCNRMSLI
jgi:L-lactate dehydrogenase (cytochrome)